MTLPQRISPSANKALARWRDPNPSISSTATEKEPTNPKDVVALIETNEFDWELAKGGGVEARLGATLTLTAGHPEDDGSTVPAAALEASSVRVRFSRWVEDGTEYGWEFSLCGQDSLTRQPAEISFHADALPGLIQALEAAEAERQSIIRDRRMED
ncbi:hypothetical protein PDG61_19245 [Mycolicibacterium sp. BiH015]|uniref:hypothetical protein n=1 Tax=Mycolicibacterium sp. BiH015 TaxID=3018808 RepID=UPI0022E27AA3|nr:hypothetical protein [Mycolicibacterium sp. BiH015]MDA2893066.1 hypothetical protein [Mycolicibacterium sp. BiH015]